jgi:phosphotransferase system enzyme I (PtsI)
VFTEVDKTPELRNRYESLRAAYLAEKDEVARYLFAEPRTADGVRVDIGMNIGGTADELEQTEGAGFAGLFRTEFLYMDKDHLPTEEEQFTAYRSVLEVFGTRAVTLRTLDIGGDKTLSYLPLPKEANPFLGNRALRLCLDRPEIFRTQLRAALRASIYGNLWIMLPMVASIDDIRKAKAFIEDVKRDLDAASIPYDRGVKVGVMIEIPSIALIADKVVREVDYASIGSNDLCQYLTAVDRMNPKVEKYYQSFHPAMFRIMNCVIREFNKAGKPIGICGELGGDVRAVPVLVGMGIRKLSMSRSQIAAVKKRLSTLGIVEMTAIAEKVLDSETEEQVMRYL